MAIAKMKRLKLVAIRTQREELLKELMLLGSVEISQPSQAPGEEVFSREPAGMAERKNELDTILRALGLLDKYAPKKSKPLSARPVVESKVILDKSAIAGALALARELEEKDSAIRAIDTEISQIKSALESLEPWRGMNVPLSLTETRTCSVITGMIPVSFQLKQLEKDLNDGRCESAVYEVSADKNMRYVLLLMMKDKTQEAAEILREYAFTQSSLSELEGTPRDNTARLKKRLTAIDKEKSSIAEQIKFRGGRRGELQLCADRLMTMVDSAENAERLLYTGATFCFEGWVPAESEPELGKLLSNYDCAWETREPQKEEYPEVPVKLKNNAFTRCLSMVTEMYSLPAYGSVDPNPLMAPFFILFYGIMMADMGYGLLMMIAGFVVLRKAKPKGGMRNFFELLTYAGISTFIMGAITAGFFGDFLPQIVRLINPESTFEWFWKPLFTPLEDTLMILIGSMALGFIHIITGMIVSFVRKAKAGQLIDGIWDEGTWWVIFAGIAMFVLNIGNIRGIPFVLVIGLLMLIIGSGRNAKGFGKIGAVFGALYNGVTGFFGDILSYSRLMALMLAGSVIAQVFNTIGSLFGSIFVFIIVSIIGNTLNFGLNILGCFVHDLRLQCLEFFGKFYEDGGKAFKPLAINTKYTNIAE